MWLWPTVTCTTQNVPVAEKLKPGPGGWLGRPVRGAGRRQQQAGQDDRGEAGAEAQGHQGRVEAGLIARAE